MDKQMHLLLAFNALIVAVASTEVGKASKGLDLPDDCLQDGDSSSSQCYLGLAQGKAQKILHLKPRRDESESLSRFVHQHDGGGSVANPHQAHFTSTSGEMHGKCHFSDAHEVHEDYGTCVIYGDPHVVGFDRGHIKDLSFLQESVVAGQVGTGDAWLVKSPLVQIQGRFNVAGPKGRVFLKQLAVGGSFLKGNVLILGGQEEPALFNGKAILSTMPSEYSEGCLIWAKYHADSVLVQDPTKQSMAPGIDVRLPLGVKLLVNRGRHGLGLAVSMPKLEGQDGQCGNFNGIQGDDTVEMISGRIGSEIDSTELLFPEPFVSLASAGTEDVMANAEAMSPKGKKKFGPVHGLPHGEVHFGAPPRAPTTSHFGKPQDDGLPVHHASDNGGTGEPTFGPADGDHHHSHYCSPDGDCHGKCHFSDPDGGFDSTCIIYGESSLVGFDDSHTKSLEYFQLSGENMNNGDVWLVKSPHVHIQGRFHVVDGKTNYLKAIAVGGPFLQGNILRIADQDGRAFWNDKEILTTVPSKFRDGCAISASFHTESVVVQDPTRASQAPGADVFLPGGIKLLVNRGKQGLGVAISMPKAPGGQDGHCGNFNDFAGDDAVELISGRLGVTIEPHELLFRQ